MSSYARNLQSVSDEELAELLSGPQPGSTNHELIKFEMHRRAMRAQQRAADASERAAVAAERYTRATYWFIAVTSLAALLNIILVFVRAPT